MQTEKKEDCNPNMKWGKRRELVKAKRKEREEETQKASMHIRQTWNFWLLQNFKLINNAISFDSMIPAKLEHWIILKFVRWGEPSGMVGGSEDCAAFPKNTRALVSQTK